MADRRYFGTDGVRGVVGDDITPELVEKLGRAAVLWARNAATSEQGSDPGHVLIGRDTRASGEALEEALAAGIVSAGGTATLAGVLGAPGVLVRTGHTEAAVDIARLAGLYPAGVICEIMNDDGTMARLPDLVKFAQLHGLKVGTIADLIAYRRKHDHFVRRTKEMDFESRNGGLFKLYVYLNTIENQEHVALVKGNISGADPPLVRMHAYNLFDDTLGAKWGQGDVLGESMRMIGAAGRGVIVLIRRNRSTAEKCRSDRGEKHRSRCCFQPLH